MLFSADAEPPYFASIFSWMGLGAVEPRERFAAEVFRLAARTPGFLGAERALETHDGDPGDDPGGNVFGLTVFYWATRPALDSWAMRVTEHIEAQYRGRDDTGLFRHWKLRVVEVQECLEMRPAAEPPAADAPPAVQAARPAQF